MPGVEDVVQEVVETIGQVHVPSLSELRVKIFADGANKEQILSLAQQSHIAGFTTNPTLMRAAGVVNFEAFSREILEAITGKPISFEVFADDLKEMERQARLISGWGHNAYVKIPITTTSGVSTIPLMKILWSEGIKTNITAVMTISQVEEVAKAFPGGVPMIVSVFAGRIADTGRDPVSLMRTCVRIVEKCSGAELLWASPRELLNLIQADAVGCHIITMTHDLLKKIPTLGYKLEDFSLDTVKMFHSDAQSAGYLL